MGLKKQYCGDDCRALIEWAIQEEIDISVTLKTAVQSSIYNSKILRLEHDRFLILGPDSDVIDFYDPVQEAFVTFTKVYNTYSFVAKYIGAHAHSVRNGTKVSSLSCYLPECIEETDRRSCERFYVENDEKIQVSFWSEEENEETENEEQGNGEDENKKVTRYGGYLHNLSLSGMGISIKPTKDVVFHNNQKFTISILSSAGRELVCLHARYRYNKELKNDEKTVLGFQFTLTNSSIEGAKTLATLGQIINHIQSSCRRELTLA
jgi:hypothetical protein